MSKQIRVFEYVEYKDGENQLNNIQGELPPGFTRVATGLHGPPGLTLPGYTEVLGVYSPILANCEYRTHCSDRYRTLEVGCTHPEVTGSDQLVTIDFNKCVNCKFKGRADATTSL